MALIGPSSNILIPLEVWTPHTTTCQLKNGLLNKIKLQVQRLLLPIEALGNSQTGTNLILSTIQAKVTYYSHSLWPCSLDTHTWMISVSKRAETQERSSLVNWKHSTRPWGIVNLPSKELKTMTTGLKSSSTQKKELMLPTIEPLLNLFKQIDKN